MPGLAALIKSLFLRDIVYVCWSQRGICRPYFYLQKVNSGPESEMPLVLFHHKAPRTNSRPFWIYSWACDRVGGKRPEGKCQDLRRMRGESSGSLRHEEQSREPLVSRPYPGTRAPPSPKKGGFVFPCLIVPRSSKHIDSGKGHKGSEETAGHSPSRYQDTGSYSSAFPRVPNLAKPCG